MKGVLADAKRQMDKFKKTDAFWQKNLIYDSCIYLPLNLKETVVKIFETLQIKCNKKLSQKHIDLDVLLANLLHRKGKPKSISLNNNDWTKSRYRDTGHFTVELITIMEQKGLIEKKLGFYDKNNKERSRKTRILATKKLLKYFPKYKNEIIVKPKELVVLRDKNRKLKEYTDTPETWRIRDILTKVNQVNSEANIEYENYKLNASLIAIFIERFTWYGRLHTNGYSHIQGFSGKERKEITINSQPVIELDYSALHPNLLYAAEKIQYPSDPYNAVDSRLEVRPFLKHILLSMLNSKDEITAERASNNWLYKNHVERELLKEIGITRARPFINKFKEIHKTISHHFCNGKVTGMKVMNQDSKIALSVIKHFAYQDIPILSIHDSFIVQEKYNSELEDIMLSMYRKHTGFTIIVK